MTSQAHSRQQVDPPISAAGRVVPNTEMNAILAEKPVRDWFAKQGLEASGGAPARMAEVLQSELDLWRKIAEVTGITAD